MLGHITAAVAVVAALAGPAAAEINMVDSIEWATADAKLVVRGRVASVQTRDDGDGALVYAVTLKIAETIKGTARGSVQIGFVASRDYTPPLLQFPKAEVLVFLVDGKRRVGDDKRYAAIALAPRRSTDGLTSVIPLDGAPAYSAAYDVLEAGADVLAATRAAARSPATESFRVDVPADSAAFKRLYGGSAVWMYVPVDAALERRAVDWIAAHDLATRAQGAAALAHFRSPANVARLDKLLADPEFAVVSGDGRSTRRYLVRAKAHEVLAGWHVKHATPVLETPAP